MKCLNNVYGIEGMVENGFAPPHPHQGNFEDISYLEKLSKLRRIDDCTLYAGALVCNSLLHMLPYKIKKK